MDLNIRGKVAVVTGATRGLGRSIAAELGREGCRVVVAGRSRANLDAALETMRGEGSEVSGIITDSTRRDGIAELFRFARDTYGDPEILVFNNGGPPNHSFAEATDEDYLEAYRRMVLAFTWCVQEVTPAMVERRWGRVVTVGSMCVKEVHRELPFVLHNMIRPAALGLSKTISDELAQFGISVNTIGTGTFDTEDDNSTFRINYRKAAANRGITFEEMVARRVAPIPAQRLGRPDEMAALAAFLCSDRAGYINGQVIIIDGGRTAAVV